MANLNIILQQIKKKEEEDTANKKRIKECESVIRAEENNIKVMKALKIKLTEDLEVKVGKNCRLEIDNEIFEHQTQIWSNLLNQTRNDLKEEEANLEKLQQSVFQNRDSFCDDMWDYVNDHDWLKMAYGLPKTSPTTSTTPFTVKTEPDDEEYKNLMESVKSLEIESNELDIKLSQIKEAKQLKSTLSFKPSSGDEFLRLQKSIHDVNLEVKSLDEQIESIKTEIAQKDLLILSKNNMDTLHQNKSNTKDKNSTNDSMDVCNSTPTLKIVKFNDIVQTKNISQSPPGSDAKNETTRYKLKTTKYTPEMPSRRLFQKKRSHEEISSKLDEEIKNILFKKK